MKATLTNDFHNSSVTVNVPANGLLSIGQTKRIYRELCGIDDCQCGGIRGRQEMLPAGKCCDTYSFPDRILITDIE